MVLGEVGIASAIPREASTVRRLPSALTGRLRASASRRATETRSSNTTSVGRHEDVAETPKEALMPAEGPSAEYAASAPDTTAIASVSASGPTHAEPARSGAKSA